MIILKELYSLVDDIKSLNEELHDMGIAWDLFSDDAGTADPGLQYELSEKIDAKLDELRKLLN